MPKKIKSLPNNDQEREPSQHLLPIPPRVAASRHGMIATAQYRATEAGEKVLAAGGNAMDAAVAAAFALGVCEPAASGLGGQTMIVLYEAASRRRVALDGSSRAPHRATPGELSKAERRRGHRATTVPSTPAVLAYALQRYGTMELSQGKTHWRHLFGLIGFRRIRVVNWWGFLCCEGCTIGGGSLGHTQIHPLLR
jgi:gamma-glutamyltranspeptidase